MKKKAFKQMLWCMLYHFPLHLKRKLEVPSYIADQDIPAAIFADKLVSENTPSFGNITLKNKFT